MYSNANRKFSKMDFHAVDGDSNNTDAWGDIPAAIALPSAAIFAIISYLFRSYNVMIWGGAWLIAALFLAWHAVWRDNGPSGKKTLNCIFIVAYAAIFAASFCWLWGQNHHYLAGLISFTGLIAMTALLNSLVGRSLIPREQHIPT